MKNYDHKKIEKKWQEVWEETGLHKAEDKSGKPKYYCLIEFPYPSGDGLHVGHIRSNTAMDIIARKRRAEGFNVLYPIGWDAFGLPTENYAIKTKTPPQIVTKQNTDSFRSQLKSLGFSFDWNREINTTDPKYYKWTQWIFLQLFKNGLAYKKRMPINWCLSCKIGLANEEVIDGACERCGGPTEKRDKEQWMLAITKYADRLSDDLDTVNYPEKIKTQQRNWIGKSEGAEIEFGLQPTTYNLRPIKVFTTRPDTLFGATYMVLAPEHPLVEKLLTDDNSQITNKTEVLEYIKNAGKKTEIERTAEGKEKTGVKLEGIFAVNPANKEQIPVFTADYVLAYYGTGAIMAVPAHDQRDFEFARKFNLPIRHVIAPETGVPHSGEEVRKSVVVIVENPRTKKILKIKWNEDFGNRRLFIGGGVEKGEDLEVAARREVLEESGYKNLNLIGTSGSIFHHYYSAAKNKYRRTEATGLYFELVNEDKTEQTLDEHERGKFEVQWVSKEDSEKDRIDELHLFVHRYFLDNKIHSEGGVVINSGKFDGLQSGEAKKKITEFVGGQMRTTYKLRDWVFSRQRYWGEPIPIIHCEKCGMVPVPENELPVLLPEIGVYTPTDTGESPLSKIDSWVNTKCPSCEGGAKRETDTMPNWAGSSWYYLRYIDPRNDEVLADKKKLEYFMPVDWYNGGMEHTTLHLLYSRFWHKFLFDIGIATGNEPYAKRTSHGMILAENGEKMSKSKGNVINPDSIVTTYGADTLRLYEMFMGPFDQAVAWSTESIIGPRRFLERVFRLKEKVKDGGGMDDKLESSLHKTIKKITGDIESMSFNTAVSGFMILVNEMEKLESISKNNFEIFLKLLAPFAPHITEELWSGLGHDSSIHTEEWPKYDESKLEAGEYTIVIQINGKVRGSFVVPASLSEEDIKKKALGSEIAQKWLADSVPKRVMYVPGKLVSIVI